MCPQQCDFANAASPQPNPHISYLQCLQEAGRQHTSKSPWEFNPLSEPAKPTVVLLHIPKTGGTSLHRMLVKNFPAEEVCPERFNRLEQLSAQDFAKFRLYSGHFDRQGVSRIPQQTRIVTLFREPRSRILSLYHFWRSHKEVVIQRANLLGPRIAKSTPLADFLRQKSEIVRKNVDNVMTRTLLGRLWVGPNGEYICPKPQVLKCAIEYIDRLHAFGVMDAFEASVHHILSALEFPVPDQIPHAIDSQKITEPALETVEREPVTADAETELDCLTEMDQQVYEYALARFRRIWQDESAGGRDQRAPTIETGPVSPS